MNIQDFFEGKIFDAHHYMGAHIRENGTDFRVYAPHALKVTVLGEFSSWQEIEMEKEYGGFYHCFVPAAAEGMMYKYKVYSDAAVTDHCDPYSFQMELRPNNASIITRTDSYTFHDDTWMQHRDPGRRYNEPLNIYELHAGSWRRNPDSDAEDNWYNYEELADLLIPYLKENGYNYLEFLPLAEHPADCSWGYQITGFFAPTSRYGTPDQLKALIDRCHQNDIGVIMDFVPVHFAMDGYALAYFDGNALYEYPSPDVGMSEWGTHNFMHAHGPVRSFLNSAAEYWLSDFHCDGLRMDAISRIIYWQGDPARGVNKDAVYFLRTMNEGLHERHPGALLIAEDSTDFLKVTAPVEYDGLGFDYKWDLGWMNDTLEYFKYAPVERPYHYHTLTFSMQYFHNELFLLPFSHDEVVHGKATIMQKMWGQYEDKFPQCRALYAYMYAHPGKKLNFMGNEIGQMREWDESREQDWDILKYPLHDSFHQYIKKLNHMYLTIPALYDGEYNPDCFRWLVVDAPSFSTYVFQRTSGDSNIIAAFNFSDQFWKDFTFPVDQPMSLTELLNSDWDIYSGKCPSEQIAELETKEEADTGKHLISMDLAPFSAHIFEVKPIETSPALAETSVEQAP
jgi:1,4-alpha-glucan branching enzyme